jgi:hypothetical protein
VENRQGQDQHNENEDTTTAVNPWKSRGEILALEIKKERFFEG